MQIGQIQSLFPGATTTAPAATQAPTGFQSLADSLIALLSDDDSSTDSTSSSASLTSLLGGEDDSTSTQSTDQLQSPPDSPSALLLQAQLGL